MAALDSAVTVTSPTFTLAHFYPTSRGNVLHIDAYRLASIHEFRDLGLGPDIDESITLIEWGDKVAQDFPAALEIEFTHHSDAPDLRLLTLTAHSERMMTVLDAMSGDRSELIDRQEDLHVARLWRSRRHQMNLVLALAQDPRY